MKLTIVYRAATPSLNKVRSEHWAKTHKRNKQYLVAIRSLFLLALAEGQPRPPRSKVTLRITVTRRRLVDLDNSIGGAKGLVDACKRAGLIVDDSPEWIDLEHIQVGGAKKRSAEQTKIEVMW